MKKFIVIIGLLIALVALLLYMANRDKYFSLKISKAETSQIQKAAEERHNIAGVSNPKKLARELAKSLVDILSSVHEISLVKKSDNLTKREIRYTHFERKLSGPERIEWLARNKGKKEIEFFKGKEAVQATLNILDIVLQELVKIKKISSYKVSTKTEPLISGIKKLNVLRINLKLVLPPKK